MNLVYLMGGIGRRAQLGYPKQYYKINGKHLFLFGLEVFCQIDEIDNIVIPSAPDKHNYIINILKNYNLYDKKKIQFVENGKTRQQSVYNGLKKVSSEYVLIGEAVRPFINKEFVREIIETEGNFITPIEPMKSTVIDIFSNIYHRDTIGPVQMPQKFLTELLITAHELSIKYCPEHEFTDDSSIVIDMISEPVKTLKGLEENIKVTTPLDILITKAMLNNSEDE